MYNRGKIRPSSSPGITERSISVVCYKSVPVHIRYLISERLKILYLQNVSLKTVPVDYLAQ